MLLSIFLPAWHVYPVLYVSLVQHCSYAYAMMKVQKLVPGGSYTYSTSALKLCQGGPHLQSNLTTKSKILYNFKPNSGDANCYGSAVSLWRGELKRVTSHTLCLSLWHGLFADLALRQCNVMIALAMKELLIYMRESPRGARSLPLTKVPTTLQ